LLENIAQRGGLEVRLCRGCGELSYYGSSNNAADYLSIDLDLIDCRCKLYDSWDPRTNVTDRLPIELESVLGHELGHAGWVGSFNSRDLDIDYPGLPPNNQMLNTMRNENPIREQLGLPWRMSRTEYNSR
jgi:hypothetical protein